MVLTQPIPPPVLSAISYVSIPLWFSRNEGRPTARRSDRPSFHTTMVLTQLDELCNWLGITVMFPYHYGSHATSEEVTPTDHLGRKFPYHYGSHATTPSIAK